MSKTYGLLPKRSNYYFLWLSSESEEKKVVLTGVEYYAISIISGAGGVGLALDQFGYGRCPLAVLQGTLDTDSGDPLTFWPVNNESVVSQSTDLNIQFVPPFSAWCRSTNMWRLDNYDPSSGKWWVTTGDTKGEPGANTLTTWFRIETIWGFQLIKTSRVLKQVA
ncbi:Proteinase inhibitor I3, Kunitz legume [Corchorus capsularis]|uniref:Proteinase inhibitor I3, Kunitz legume n=1 Tax=Corchorus capsularis TaxID=210143 RepID=A0A1R3HCX3_COCAP|nr:Proteinase inhibitor I3, Kunitz legume [Corchorus capsularis]